MVEKSAEQLEGHVFEGQGGTVEQFQQVEAVTQVDQWRHLLSVEAPVGVGDHGSKGVLVHRIAHERGHHLNGRLQVVPVSAVSQLGPGLGYVQAAVVGQTGQQRLAELENRSHTPGAHVAHRATPGATISLPPPGACCRRCAPHQGHRDPRGWPAGRVPGPCG